MHGLGRSADDWSGVAAGLERFGELRAPALPRKPGPALRHATAALEPGAIVVGHSFGGVLALRLAREGSVPLRAVVLTGCFFPPARNGRPTGASLRDYAAHRVAYVRALSRGGGERTAGAESRAGGGAALRSLAGLGLRRRRFYEDFSAVRAPVLVVHARDDHHVPLAFALAAVARREATGLEVLDRGGHHAHVARPARWLEAVAPWLSLQLASSRP